MKFQGEHKKAGKVASMPNALWLCGCDSPALLFSFFRFLGPCNEGGPEKLGAEHFSLECFTAQIWQDVRLNTASILPPKNHTAPSHTPVYNTLLDGKETLAKG